MRVSIRLLIVAACGLALGLPDPGEAGRRRRPPSHEAAGRLTFASPQVNPIALSPDESLLLVASTTSNQVDVISTATNTVIGEVPVGIDPGTIAFKPDGSEAWVSNHVSDSVSVIDTNPASAGYLTVVETVQDLVGGVTEFDEPTGIAFKGDGSEAYVALSSRDDVAIVDTTSYAVTGRVHITAQDPRALFVLGDYLYVAAFESSNQSELSICEDLADAPDCTIDASDIAAFAIDDPNLPNEIKDITIDPGLPDRDLFVFDISAGLSDGALPVDSVTGMGTLLYGLVGQVNGGAHDLWVSQTDARNDANGDDGLPLADLDNRMFLNQLTRVSCTSGSCGSPTRMDVEVLVPSQPAAGNALATPYGIVLTSDGSTVVATAAASSRIFSYDATGTTDSDVLDRLDVGEIPRGIAFVPSGPSTDAGTAYVLNTLGNSVSVVTVGAGGTLALDGTVAVNPIPVGDDPTPTLVRLGRIAFNDADASTSGTFSCASCHPDGNTDQLLWRIGGQCQACNGEEPRTTMPVRGLRDTVPLHWDGALGDPFGGPSGEDPNGNASPSQTAGGVTCEIDNQQACFRHLVEASLSGVMCDQDPPGCANGPTGEPGLLDDTERQNMAIFLERVSYPPARERPIGDVVSAMALDGFDDFFRDNPGNRGGPLANSLAEPVTCADTTAGCHELPLGTASNSETLGAFEAPTMRG
ncbi:MAG: beta-propeller fold lactonase family protein, partial [Myxococcota bacterium]